MNGTDDMLAEQAKLSHQEIVERFRKVFGREMTPAERRSFFLDLPLSVKEITDDL